MLKCRVLICRTAKKERHSQETREAPQEPIEQRASANHAGAVIRVSDMF